MGKYLINIGPKTQAVIIGILALVGLVWSPLLIYYWRDDARSEAQYQAAPVCTGTEQKGCRREIQTVVKSTDYTYNRHTTYYVHLLQSDGSKLKGGDLPVWWDQDHSLYSSLKSGDRVTAEEWEGMIVILRGANNKTLRTQFDPAYRREHTAVAAVIVPLVTLFIIFMGLIFFKDELFSTIRKKNA